MKTERIIILEKNVMANLKRCPICNINFCAFDKCTLCELRLNEPEKYKEFMEILK